MTRYLVWVFAGVALVLFGVFLIAALFFGQEGEAPIRVVKPATYGEAFSKLRGVRVGDVDIGDRANAVVSELRVPLNKLIAHEISAQAAQPALTEAVSHLAELRGLVDQLKPETRKVAADSFAAIRPRINTLLETASGLPEVGPVIQPTISEIHSKLDALAQNGSSSGVQ